MPNRRPHNCEGGPIWTALGEPQRGEALRNARKASHVQRQSKPTPKNGRHRRPQLQQPRSRIMVCPMIPQPYPQPHYHGTHGHARALCKNKNQSPCESILHQTWATNLSESGAKRLHRTSVRCSHQLDTARVIFLRGLCLTQPTKVKSEVFN